MLHSSLARKIHVMDLPLSTVLLEDNSHYPWLILVPRRTGACRLMDLSEVDQLQLLRELDIAQKVLWDLFKPTQLNVAAIGNKTPQLHVHVVARYQDDPAWPDTVWGHGEKLPYTLEEKEKLIQILKGEFLLKEKK